jgi:hypothetical protein
VFLRKHHRYFRPGDALRRGQHDPIVRMQRDDVALVRSLGFRDAKPGKRIGGGTRRRNSQRQQARLQLRFLPVGGLAPRMQRALIRCLGVGADNGIPLVM